MVNQCPIENSGRQPYQIMYNVYLDTLRAIDIEHKVLDMPVYMHWHEFCELEFIVRGSGVHKYNNQVIPLEAGALYLQLPTDFHEVLVDEEDPPELYSIKFSEGFIEPSVYQAVFSSNRQRQVVLRGKEYTDTLHDFKQAQEEFLGDCVFREHVLKGLVEKIIIGLERSAAPADVFDETAGKPKDAAVSIRQCLVYIQNHYNQPITLKELAARSNMSPNYFSSYFRKNVGCTFQNYVKNLRMRFAVSYLANFEVPVYEVAEMVGYSNYEHFERMFRREIGVSPRIFRDTLREKRRTATINLARDKAERLGGVKMLSPEGDRNNI